MGNELKVLNIFGMDMTVYFLVLLAASAAAAVFACALAPKYQIKRWEMALYMLLSGILGLFFGRLIHCLVQYEFMFFGPMGEALGIAPFFHFEEGNVNVIGVLAGFILAAPIVSGISRKKAGSYLDAAVFPGLLLFAAARFAEPLSGQGYGNMMENAAFCFFPVAIENEWGDFTLSVCFIESMLALLIPLILFFGRKKIQKSGTLAMYALTMLFASQVMPESLRRDSFLSVLIFARVTQIGYAVGLVGMLVWAFIRGRKSISKKNVFTESLLMLAGVGICIGAEFALDKSNISDTLIYLVMILTLFAMTFMILRRIQKGDVKA